MLVQLRISDFAIIRHLDISFRPGLNILSGETGAGKSIIIDAMNLVLGGRASSNLIRSGCGEAGVEALFSIPENASLLPLLSDFGIPHEGDLLIKRSISKEGRNKISINGSLITLQMLSKMGEHLISISGQHEHQLLLRPENHLLVLDDFGGLLPLRSQLARTYKRFQRLNGEILREEEEIQTLEARRDLALFQREEIERAEVRPGEDEALTAERKRLRHAEDLLNILSESHQILYEREDSVLSLLSQCTKRIGKGVELDPELAPIEALLREIQLKLEDASFALRDQQRGISRDPGKLEEVSERIQLLNALKKKYGPTLEDVLVLQQGLTCRLQEIEEKREMLLRKEKEREAVSEELVTKGMDLSEKRRILARQLEKAVEKELSELQMAATRFQVRFAQDSISGGLSEDISRMGVEGFDRVEFMISPNPGEEVRPLARIASGGELSRIMLALKSILAKSASVETLIFDEVDAGIGGGAADVVGEKILSLAKFHQILCITHLPQIASRGETHFQVKKEVRDGRTHAVISELDPEGRVHEVARLLGGRTITPRAVAHAREMISRISPHQNLLTEPSGGEASG
jgi:DNA repair protein RecN (Recombination protein N)